MVEAKRRDHRVLGKKLDLFSLQEDAGGGLVSAVYLGLSGLVSSRLGRVVVTAHHRYYDTSLHEPIAAKTTTKNFLRQCINIVMIGQKNG